MAAPDRVLPPKLTLYNSVTSIASTSAGLSGALTFARREDLSSHADSFAKSKSWYSVAFL